MHPFQEKETLDDAVQNSRYVTMIDSPFAPMKRWGILRYAILCLLFIGAVYTLLHGFPADLPTQAPPSDAATRWGYYRDELGKALNEAATEDKYVVVTMLNKAYVEGEKPMLDIFLEALWLGERTHRLLRHLLVVTLDSNYSCIQVTLDIFSPSKLLPPSISRW